MYAFALPEYEEWKRINPGKHGYRAVFSVILKSIYFTLLSNVNEMFFNLLAGVHEIQCTLVMINTKYEWGVKNVSLRGTTRI